MCLCVRWSCAPVLLLCGSVIHVNVEVSEAAHWDCGMVEGPTDGLPGQEAHTECTPLDVTLWRDASSPSGCSEAIAQGSPDPPPPPPRSKTGRLCSRRDVRASGNPFD